MDWLSLHSKLGKQEIKNMHSDVMLKIDDECYCLKLCFDKKNNPYFTIINA